MTTQPRTLAVPPLRKASASSMQSPPARARATSAGNLSPVLARPGGVAQIEVPLHRFTQTRAEGKDGGHQPPGIGHQAVIIKGGIDAIGTLK